MKAIVLYCSLSGNTEKIAKRIARDFKCDILKIEPDIVYGGYLSAVARVLRDRIRGEIPGSVTETPDLSAYDTVFVGFPIWYNSVPEFAQEFLMRCDLNGKRLFPFATSGASYITASVNCLADICTGAEILKPFTFSVSHRDNFEDWELCVAETCEEEEKFEGEAEKAAEAEKVEADQAAGAEKAAEADQAAEAAAAGGSTAAGTPGSVSGEKAGDIEDHDSHDLS